jgi:hypothetical protein
MVRCPNHERGGNPIGHLGECVTLFFVEMLVHVTAAAWLNRVDDAVEAVPQDAKSVHAHGEHVRDRHR